MSEREIETKVDQLLSGPRKDAGKNQKQKQRHKHFKQRVAVIGILLVAAGVVSAASFMHYAKVETTASAQGKIYVDSNLAEDYVISEDFDIYAMQSIESPHNVTADTPVFFNITNDTGITASIIYLANPITQLDFEVNTVYAFKEQTIDITETNANVLFDGEEIQFHFYDGVILLKGEY